MQGLSSGFRWARVEETGVTPQASHCSERYRTCSMQKPMGSDVYATHTRILPSTNEMLSVTRKQTTLKVEGLTEVDWVAPLLRLPPSLWKKASPLDCCCGSASWTTPATRCVAPPPTPGVEGWQQFMYTAGTHSLTCLRTKPCKRSTVWWSSCLLWPGVRKVLFHNVQKRC